MLRTKETIDKFKAVPPVPGQTSPLLVYFGTLLTKGKLNAYESVELSLLVLSQNKKHLLDNWLREVSNLLTWQTIRWHLTAHGHTHVSHRGRAPTILDYGEFTLGDGVQDKLEPSEQLGDLLRQAGDNDAALQCYQKANVPGKVIEGLAAKGDFAELTRYSGQQVSIENEPCPTPGRHDCIALLPGEYHSQHLR